MARVVAAPPPYEVTGANPSAAFTLKIHRGEGMCLLAMNWKNGSRPPNDFVGFAIQYREPGNPQTFEVPNRLTFVGADPKDPKLKSTLRSPIQKFRWVHFPRNAHKDGLFDYRVTPIFMNAGGDLREGEPQTASVQLASETYPGALNVTFTRGFVSSQAFVDHFGNDLSRLLPPSNAQGLDFDPTDPKRDEAYQWMGFEARKVILELLQAAVDDASAEVRVVAYDLNLPEVLEPLKKLGKRLKIIIDSGDDKQHGIGSAENEAAKELHDAGVAARRGSMANIQHNKFIAVAGRTNKVVCGSTNFSWRGFFVQANNAVVLTGEEPVSHFMAAFDEYWRENADDFRKSPFANWEGVKLPGVKSLVTFSPHSAANRKLDEIIGAIENTASSLFYSLAFLYEPRGNRLSKAIGRVVSDRTKFVYGMSDHPVAGLDIRKPDGNLAIVSPGNLQGDLPEPFKSEPTGGRGTRMHHKFAVIDFNRDDARVYLGSHNFSPTADEKNGENLLCIRDRRIATSYMIEALRLFDHYHFRANMEQARKNGRAPSEMRLRKPPRAAGERPWFDEYYTDPQKKRDRLLFA